MEKRRQDPSTRADSSAKRPKLNKRCDDDYLPGNITEIELHNFMTFTHLKCQPGPRLNLVVGPNGAGKSSLVCAIALGLAGEPQLLGRASSVGAFVKRGEESGFIRISLRGDTVGEQLTITRRIDMRNKSEWMFNGKVVPKKDVQEIIKRFNIQVNNLTQFLPQDRVCEFAKLTPVQLLEETEKAVGDPQLPVQHQQLINKSQELKKLEVTVKQNGDTLNQLKALNAEQEKDVERVRQREQLLSKADSMRKKLPWLKYDKLKVEYVQAGKDEADAKKNMDAAAKVLHDLNAPIEKQKKLKEKLEAAQRNVSKVIAKNSDKRLESLEHESHLGVQVRGAYKEMEEMRKQEESRQHRISQAKADLASAELDLANLPVYTPPKDEIERLKAEIAELDMSAKRKINQKSDKEQQLHLNKRNLRLCTDRLKEMENATNKILQTLKNSGCEKIFEAYQLIQENRHKLNKEVYGPVLLEVKVPTREHAAYLEGQVAYYAWKSFITQDDGDRDTLVKVLKPYDVPVLNYIGDRFGGNVLPEISEQMRKLGIYSRLDQVFDSANAVKEVLTSQFGLDRSFIGSKETDKKADVAPNLGIHDLWTPENHYRWSESRYGGHVSAIVEPVSQSRLFLCSPDTGELEKSRARKKELEGNISDLEGNIKSLLTEQRNFEDEAAKLRKQYEELTNTGQLETKKRRSAESLVLQRKRKLDAIEREDDLDTNMKKLVDKVTKLNKERFETVIEIKKMLIELVGFKRSFAEKNMACIELEVKIQKMRQNIKEQEKFALQASMQFEDCKKRTERSKQQLAAAKRHAESIAIITPALSEEFKEMPSTIEELEAAIQDNVSQANSILFLNHNVLEEYETRQRKIESLSTKLEADNEDLKNCLTEIGNLKESWLLTLRNLVEHINETFSRNFQEMAVAGEVSLDEREMDFDKFGILIKVKFRQAGQLQVLSAHHQSGGERSVSTILYLVSLQDITNCPFRVVDEINQGMDPINERKMFQQLVRAASQPNSPQCFLLTPKLLPELDYSEACSILTVVNGPWIEEPTKVWGDGERWGQIMGVA
ncbi:Structural maintenance of chromosomes protein 5 [Ranunculus cassubicifolius]